MIFPLVSSWSYSRPADSIPTRVVYPDQDTKSCQDTRIHPEFADSFLSWEAVRAAESARIQHLPGYNGCFPDTAYARIQSTAQVPVTRFAWIGADFVENVPGCQHDAVEYTIFQDTQFSRIQ